MEIFVAGLGRVHISFFSTVDNFLKVWRQNISSFHDVNVSSNILKEMLIGESEKWMIKSSVAYLLITVTCSWKY